MMCIKARVAEVMCRWRQAPEPQNECILPAGRQNIVYCKRTGYASMIDVNLVTLVMFTSHPASHITSAKARSCRPAKTHFSGTTQHSNSYQSDRHHTNQFYTIQHNRSNQSTNLLYSFYCFRCSILTKSEPNSVDWGSHLVGLWIYRPCDHMH